VGNHIAPCFSRRSEATPSPSELSRDKSPFMPDWSFKLQSKEAGRVIAAIAACAFTFLLSASAHAASIPVVTAKNASPRAQWGAEQLRAALASVKNPPRGARVIAALATAPELKRFKLPEFPPHSEEAFLIRQAGNTWVIAGSDASGVLYGELELRDRIRA